MRLLPLSLVCSLLFTVALAACGDDDDDTSGNGGAAGQCAGGSAGSAGASPDCPCDPAQVTSCGPGKLCKAGGDGAGKCVEGCLVDNPATCSSDQVCEQVEGSDPRCFAPVVIEGIVQRSTDEQPIAGALVTARDETGGVASSVAVSGPEGVYRIQLPARRAADGKPLSTIYTLRSDAAGYLSFPGALRPALPLDLATATGDAAGSYVLKNTATTVVLIARPSTEGLGTIRGVVKADKPGGTLVVAGGASGLADASGAFVVFNVPAGAVEVRGYAAGLSLAAAQAQVPAGGEVTDVTLSAAGQATATVGGSVNLVDATAGNGTTSVVLAVEDTFLPTLEIGEVPRGLRALKVSGAFSIAGVPDGKYVVLASLDNDGLVRDPDPGIAGTQIVHLTVSDGKASSDGFNFKVTSALAVKSPGATAVDAVTGTPTFVWANDSSEEAYDVLVYDALGTQVWSKLGLAAPKGSGDVSLPYGGPALTVGQLYQFRATSLRKGKPISRTEELRGVFFAR